MAAILDFQLPVTSYSIPIDAIGLPVPENMGVAFGISFRCVTDAEIRLVKCVGKLRLKNLLFSRNLPHGKNKYLKNP